MHMQHGRGHEAWTWTTGHAAWTCTIGHAARTWICSMDIDTVGATPLARNPISARNLKAILTY
jgi:hypothetical protein